MTTPAWAAQINGLPGDLTATDASAGLNQLLGTHATTESYTGAQIVTPGTVASPTSGSVFFWITPSVGIGDLNVDDVDFVFTMPGGSTTIGRIQAAMLPIGNGADIKATLCTDSAGSPNTAAPLASTIIPAAQINNLAAPGGLATTAGPVGTQFSNILQTGPITQVPWGTASTSATGVISSTTTASFGQYMVLAGGLDTNSSAAVSSVFSVPLTSTGAGAATTQPSIPQSLDNVGLAVTSDTVVVAGGFTGSSYVNTVYTASWNSNTGVIGSWAAQATLPATLSTAQAAVYNDTYVYVIGGYNGTSPLSTVYVGAMQNQQISSWKTATPLPVAAFGHIVGIVGNILVVAGGVTSSGPGSNALSATYWTFINADGSLQGWQTGPPMPVAVAQTDGNTMITDSGLFVVGGITVNTSPLTFTTTLQSLTVTENGLGAWQQQQYPGSSLSLPTGGYANGDGTYTMVSLGTQSGGFTNYSTVYTVPFISIPLPATGLTSGNTYHVVFHQLGGNANNYVQIGDITGPITQEWLYSPKLANTWSSASATSLLVNVFDQTASGNLIHTWQDPDANNLAQATSMSVYNYRNLLLGFCEGYVQPNGPLNSNPTFTSGVSPWTAVDGTITQSNVQTHGGFPFSGLLTPTGGFTQAFAQSELFPIHQTIYGTEQPYTATGWFFSPTGWTNFALNINWYDSGSNFISTAGVTTPLTINTWDQVTVTFTPPPTAAFASLAPTEFGSPGVTNLLYMSDVFMTQTDRYSLSSVAAVDYGMGTVWPPIGVTQLN